MSFGDAVLPAGHAAGGPAHPALGGGIDRVGQADAACSFLVPQKPQVSFWILDMSVVAMDAGHGGRYFGLIVATPLATRCSI